MHVALVEPRPHHPNFHRGSLLCIYVVGTANHETFSSKFVYHGNSPDNYIVKRRVW